MASIKRMRGLFWTILVCAWVASSSAKIFSREKIAEIRSFIKTTIGCRNVPAMSVAVVKGEETWAKGFGTADLDTGRAQTADSLTGIGSVTKSFTMTLLGILLEENGFTWSDKLSTVLGEEFRFGDDLRTSETTLRDLLSHRTGLAGLDFGHMAGYSAEEITRAKLARKLRHLPEVLPFRDRFLYNNYVYMLVGHICERLGGDSWETLLKTRLLVPLGMTSSFVLKNPAVDFLRDEVSKPYFYKDGLFQNSTQEIYNIFPMEPAGAIMASASDMLKWMKFHLAGGKTASGEELLTENMLKEAAEATMVETGWTLERTEFPVADTGYGYGYAWLIGTYRGYPKYWHGGAFYSFTSYLWIIPHKQIALYAGVNGPDTGTGLAALQTVIYYMADVLLEETPWLNKTTTCTFPAPWAGSGLGFSDEDLLPCGPLNPMCESYVARATNDVRSASGPKLETSDVTYVGVYRSPMFADVTITELADSDPYTFRFVFGRVSGNLRPIDTDVFRLKMTDPVDVADQFISGGVTLEIGVVFTRKRGQIKSMALKFEADMKFDKVESSA